MKILGRKEIDALIAARSDYCVSIYLPVHRLGDAQDSIRYRNLLGKAERLLTEKGMRAPDAAKFLAPEYELAARADYWMDLGAEGLAVFLVGQFRERYPLPRKVRRIGNRDRELPHQTADSTVNGRRAVFHTGAQQGEYMPFSRQPLQLHRCRSA
jgi:hypothetical protein